MTPAIVDGVARRRKIGIGERSNGDADTARFTFLGVEKVGAAHGAEPEPELCTLITRTDVLSGFPEDFVRPRETREGREDAASSLLAGKAMANADNARLTFNFDAKLPTVAGGGSG